jgi:hypothetical protein
LRERVAAKRPGEGTGAERKFASKGAPPPPSSGGYAATFSRVREKEKRFT